MPSARSVYLFVLLSGGRFYRLFWVHVPLPPPRLFTISQGVALVQARVQNAFLPPPGRSHARAHHFSDHNLFPRPFTGAKHRLLPKSRAFPLAPLIKSTLKPCCAAKRDYVWDWPTKQQ
uniref:Secreted protein n=1 Tax=Steinernema glaseri TaxID=37863 RepID=A0A1I8A699_9BILA